MKWYYVVDRERFGPVEEDEFRQRVDDGTITAKTLVWNQEMTDWQAFETVSAQQEVPDAVPPSPGDSDAARITGDTAFCSECGRSFPRDELISYETSKICAGCKPVFVQKIREGLTVGYTEYGGFWIRFGATVIDGMIMSVVNMVAWILGMLVFFPLVGLEAFENPDNMTSFFIFQGTMYLVQFALHITYQTWFLGRYGATPGKMICGLVVVTGDKEKITYMRALGRYFAEMLNGFTLGLTYLMVVFDDQKRGLHDRICDTLVIKKES